MNGLVLSLLFTCCVTLATMLGPMFDRIKSRSGPETGPLLALVGDGRELFANQFYTMADEYFHSGYYPTIFDKKKTEGPSHMDVSAHQAEAEANAKSEKPDDDDSFMGRPHDWIEKFGRNFIPTVHTHLAGDTAREMLPWLKLSAEMDPKRIEVYVTAAYWLTTRLGQTNEAEQFLRQGLAANPDSYEILLWLGRAIYYGHGNSFVARNLWNRAVEEWQRQDKAGENPDPHVHEEILGELVRDDQRSHNDKQLLIDLEALAKIAPGREVIDQQIEQVKARLEH